MRSCVSLILGQSGVLIPSASSRSTSRFCWDSNLRFTFLGGIWNGSSLQSDVLVWAVLGCSDRSYSPQCVSATSAQAAFCAPDKDGEMSTKPMKDRTLRLDSHYRPEF